MCGWFGLLMPASCSLQCDTVYTCCDNVRLYEATVVFVNHVICFCNKDFNAGWVAEQGTDLATVGRVG